MPTYINSVNLYHNHMRLELLQSPHLPDKKNEAGENEARCPSSHRQGGAYKHWAPWVKLSV